MTVLLVRIIRTEQSRAEHGTADRAEHSRAAVQLEMVKIYIDMVNSHIIDGARHALSGQRMEAKDKDEPAE